MRFLYRCLLWLICLPFSAKLKAPLLSLGAAGAIGKSIVYFAWKGIDAVREYVIPSNPRSAAQITQRGYFTAAVLGWHDNAYTDADRIAWNRYAGTLAKIMSGFNAMIRVAVAALAVPSLWRLISDIQVDTPTVNGFDVDVENSVAGYTLRARIGTSRTHFPIIQALVDDVDGTYSLTWAAGASGVDYYVFLEDERVGVQYRVSGIYHVRTV